jgi:excisionase family DNA binding protein
MSDENNKPEDDSEFIRVKDAAAMGKTSPRTIWRSIADGQLTAYRFRRCTRLLRSQVMNYFKGNGKVGGV